MWQAEARTKEARTRGATSTGRGLAWIAAAKAWFIVTGYAVQLLLPRLLGSPEAFGFYATAMTDVSILNNVLIAATVQTVSKKVSENEAAAGVALRQGLLVQLAWGGALGLGLFLLAPFIAGTLKLNPAQAPLYRTAAAVVLAYALYATFVGSLNGRRRFVTQARLDMAFSTLRSTAILGAAAAGLGAAGVFAGFAAAAVTITLVALLLVGTGHRGAFTPLRTWVAFMAPLWAYQLCLNAILQVDVSILSRTAIAASLSAGAAAEEATRVGDRLGGFYRSAQTFAFVPYQLILSVTFVVFPLVARATASGDPEGARMALRRAMRASMLFLLGLAAPMAGAAEGVIRVAYTADYLPAAQALRVLVLGLVPFALFVVAATAVSGAGRPEASALIAAGALVTLVASVRAALGLVGIGSDEAALVAAAAGTSVGAVVALVAVGVVCLRTFRTFIPIATVVRGTLAAGAGAAVAYVVPHDVSRPMALVALAAGFAAYGTMLVATGEVPRSELRAALAPMRARWRRRRSNVDADHRPAS
jgi:stage V sporulation protein B